MTNIITAITFTLLVTNWHGVENTQNEVEIVTRQTHLQFGTNTFLLSSEDTIGAGGLRKRKLEYITTTNMWFSPAWTNYSRELLFNFRDVKPDQTVYITNQ